MHTQAPRLGCEGPVPLGCRRGTSSDPVRPSPRHVQVVQVSGALRPMHHYSRPQATALQKVQGHQLDGSKSPQGPQHPCIPARLASWAASANKYKEGSPVCTETAARTQPHAPHPHSRGHQHYESRAALREVRQLPVWPQRQMQGCYSTRRKRTGGAQVTTGRAAASASLI